MVGLAEAKLLIEVLGGAMSLIDKLYPKLHWLVTGATDESDHRVQISRTDAALEARSRDGACQRVTYEELVQLMSADDLAVLRTHEKRIQNVLPVIEELYAGIDLMGGDEKARERQRMRQRVASVSADLQAILSYVEKIGLDLEDHYSRARYWIKQIDAAGAV